MGGAVGCETRGGHRTVAYRHLPTCSSVGTASWTAVSGMLAHARTRLVTLTGPPGIGKTRLAVACASAHAERSG